MEADRHARPPDRLPARRRCRQGRAVPRALLQGDEERRVHPRGRLPRRRGGSDRDLRGHVHARDEAGRQAVVTILDQLIAAKANKDYAAMFEAIPYARLLGLAPEVDGDGLITRMKYGEHTIGNAALPAIHGGANNTLLESAAIFELRGRAGAGGRPGAGTGTGGY